jgi:hypothetical protein
MRLVIRMSADDSNGNAHSARACAKPAVPCMVYVVGMLRVVASSSARARWHVRACDALRWWMCGLVRVECRVKDDCEASPKHAEPKRSQSNGSISTSQDPSWCVACVMFCVVLCEV